MTNVAYGSLVYFMYNFFSRLFNKSGRVGFGLESLNLTVILTFVIWEGAGVVFLFLFCRVYIYI